MSWPGYDPMHFHNTTDNNLRRTFTGVNAVPFWVMDGTYSGNWPPFTSYYNNRINVPTSVSVEIGGFYDAGAGTIDVSVTATTTVAMPGGSNLRIYIALIEDNIYFNGSNSTDWHRHTMRDMDPTGGGGITFSGDLPQSASVDAAFVMDPVYAEAECLVAAWVQDASTKEVFNAEWVTVQSLADLTSTPAAMPLAMELGRNFPNPFNPSTKMTVSVERAGQALLEIVSVDGRVLRTLHDGALPTGSTQFAWDGMDEQGRAVASGVYMARLLSADGIQSQRLVLLK